PWGRSYRRRAHASATPRKSRRAARPWIRRRLSSLATVFNCEQGCQYASIAFGLRCRVTGVRPLMGSVGDAYDSALGESFFATPTASFSIATDTDTEKKGPKTKSYPKALTVYET